MPRADVVHLVILDFGRKIRDQVVASSNRRQDAVEAMGTVLSSKIFHIAVHELRRDKDGFSVVLGQKELTIGPTTTRVTEELYDLYSRKASKSHGKFSTGADSGPTETHLKAFVASKAKEFATLTATMMTTLKTQAALKSAAGGGYVFFAHFERDARQFLLVAIVTKKLGALLTRDLDVRDVEHLDMDGFRFAGRINLTGWLGDEERYIGFLKGKGDVSAYFRAFLGCDTTVQARQDTNDLVAALKSFADESGMDGATKETFLSRARAIGDRLKRAGEELAFESFSNELTPNEPQILLTYLIHPDRKLNDGFVPDGRALSLLTTFKGKTRFWAVDFDRKALDQGKVVFDREANALILHDLPDDLAAELRKELTADG